MSTAPATGYHFKTTAQWQTCLLAQAEGSVTAGVTSLDPFAPYLSSPTPGFASNDAFAPAYTRGRVTLWRDGDRHLLRAYQGDTQPERHAAPEAIGAATRMIGTATDLWVPAAAPDSLQCFDVESLSRRLTVDLSPGRVLDIARDAADGIIALVHEEESLVCVHVSCAGAIGARVKLDGMQGESNVLGFGVVGALGAGNSAVFAVLTRGPGNAGDRLYWFMQDGGAHFKVTQLAAYAPCFEAAALTGDATGRLYVAGTDNHGGGPRSHVMIFDAASTLVDDVNLYQRPTGIATSRNALLVTGAGGLYVLAATDTVPDDVNQVQGMILTPVLESPDVPDGRRWLRVEIVCDLPAGATLQIACAATDDPAERDKLNQIAATTLPAAQRVQNMLAEPNIWQPPIALHGSSSPPPQAGVPFAAPLYDIHARYLWVCVTMVAGAGAVLPSITRLSVLYPGRTLMENLPALYQRDEATPGRFLRSLVGVLETTTHTLDDTISSLGANIHPDTAAGPWLDYVARWLGLPWDDTLDVSQKKAIVENAEFLAAQRGTRAGLSKLLACLLPGTPVRYRIADFTVDYGMATVGGASCKGSALPALLGGLPASAARLDVQATLGCMRLPCGVTEVDPFARFVGLLVVEVAASAREKRLWTPWFANVLSSMVPLTARLQIRWLGPDAFVDGTLGDTLILGHPSNPRLGTDAVTGQVWLPDGASTLSARATRGGFTLH
jgi:phage tail-like protein